MYNQTNDDDNDNCGQRWAVVAMFISGFIVMALFIWIVKLVRG